MKKIILTAWLLVCVILVKAQNITKMEYWVDVDSGFGAGINITGFTPSGNVTSYTFSVPSSIGSGIHTIGVRSKDANNIWSHSNIFPALVFTPEPTTTIDHIEYFVDTDGGIGTEIPVTGFSPQPNVTNFAFSIPVTGLTQGIHTVGVRSKGADGKWGHTNFFPFLINDTSNYVIESIEYFWDVDSGYYYYLPYTPSQTVSDLSNEIMNVYVPPTLSQGNHTLFLRSRDNGGHWSHVNYNPNISVGIYELSENSEISIYPNPFTDHLTVTPKQNQKVHLMLYSENGQLVINKIVTEKTQLDTQGLARGSYTVFIWAEGNKIYRSTVIRQ